MLRVEGPGPFLLHVEVQSSYDPSLPRRLFRYNALLDLRHELPVQSVAVLLWREADGPAMDGVLWRVSPLRPDPIVFPYQVIRVWEQAMEEHALGPGTFPLVAMAAASEEELRAVASPVLAAFHDPPTEDERELKMAFYLLVGRQFSKKLADELLQGDQAMRELETYLAIFDEGRQEGWLGGERNVILRQATHRFGQPNADALSRLMAVNTQQGLDKQTDRVLTATGWDDLLREVS